HPAPPLHAHTSWPPERLHTSPGRQSTPLHSQMPVSESQMPFVATPPSGGSPLHCSDELHPHRFDGRRSPPQTRPPWNPIGVQSFSHPPQLVTLLGSSQPSSEPLCFCRQLAYPSTQALAHTPSTHDLPAVFPEPHGRPHAPQLSTSDEMSTSQ